MNGTKMIIQRKTQRKKKKKSVATKNSNAPWEN